MSPCAPRPSVLELRLQRGAEILKTASQGAPRGYRYVFRDTGQMARADDVERLIEAGKLVPAGDGLFPSHSQTWVLAPEVAERRE